ncbi:cation diffusion facilitator family transporter [Flaviaesturariibacter flavus]|uniref:cation diffusion facilitator family transporter n=1 Tax=Flaviaesturariibacter flavus TaxID=2502780 RepID=UPI001FB1FD5A|nr:cation diffusion facilitator family transporter [Flaviaesturariibacter flavus]
MESGQLELCNAAAPKPFLTKKPTILPATTHTPNANLRLQFWIAVASCLLLLAKFFAYFRTNSVAVLTDALESIVNVAAAFIGLYSLYVSAKPRDTDHPYGHGKAEFISAAVEGTLVLSAGALIIFKAVKTFFIPEKLHPLDVGIYIIAGTALVNWLLGMTAVRQGKKSNSLALIASGRHLQTDTWSTLGIVAALLLLRITGWLWIDSVVAVAMGILILFTGYRILRQSLAGIMDEADMDLLSRMVEVLNSNRRDGWIDLHNLRVIKYGNTLHMDCHLTVPWYFNVHQAHQEIDQLASLARTEFGESLELFVHSDGCLYFQCPICDKKDCPVRQHAFRQEIRWTVDNILQNKKHGPGDL